MDESIATQLVPGARVTVTQQIPARDYVWASDVRGTVVSFHQRQTGSWFAHARDDKLWLDRLTVRKPDGELTTLNLDEYTRVQIDSPATADSTAAAEKKNESDLPV